MNDTLLRLVYDRLDRDAAVDEPWAELVMAACEGEAAVEAVLDEQHAAAPLPAPAATASDPPGVFLRSISVAGFRGVGHKTTLEVSSGPGRRALSTPQAILSQKLRSTGCSRHTT